MTCSEYAHGAPAIRLYGGRVGPRCGPPCSTDASSGGAARTRKLRARVEAARIPVDSTARRRGGDRRVVAIAAGAAGALAASRSSVSRDARRDHASSWTRDASRPARPTPSTRRPQRAPPAGRRRAESAARTRERGHARRAELARRLPGRLPYRVSPSSERRPRRPCRCRSRRTAHQLLRGRAPAVDCSRRSADATERR